MLDMELLLEGFASAESLHIPVLEFWRRQLLGKLEGPWKTVKLAADFAALLRQLSQLPPGQHPSESQCAWISPVWTAAISSTPPPSTLFLPTVWNSPPGLWPLECQAASSSWALALPILLLLSLLP